MPLVEKVSWDNAGPDDIAYRFPQTNLKYGTQVIVRENNGCVLQGWEGVRCFRTRQAHDNKQQCTLVDGCAPETWVIGQIFDCQVIYVSNSQFRANFGGSAYSAPSGDMKYQAELGFFGYTLYKVEDPKLFVAEFFGNKGVSSSRDIESYIRGFITERVIDQFGDHDIFSLVKNVDETTDIVSLKISDEASRIGLKIIDCVSKGSRFLKKQGGSLLEWALKR